MSADTDATLAEMREAAAEFGPQTSVTIERVVFGPAKHAIRVKRGRKTVGPLLFPAESQTIGQCLDLFLEGVQ